MGGPTEHTSRKGVRSSQETEREGSICRLYCRGSRPHEQNDSASAGDSHYLLSANQVRQWGLRSYRWRHPRRYPSSTWCPYPQSGHLYKAGASSAQGYRTGKQYYPHHHRVTAYLSQWQPSEFLSTHLTHPLMKQIVTPIAMLHLMQKPAQNRLQKPAQNCLQEFTRPTTGHGHPPSDTRLTPP